MKRYRNVLAIVVVLLGTMPTADHILLAQSTAAEGLTSPAARPAVEDIPAPGLLRNLDLIGHNPILDPTLRIPRGMNAALAIEGDCAFVGSRNGFQDIAVLDISNPASPAVIGRLPGIPGASSRELKALVELDALYILNIRRGGDSAVLKLPSPPPFPQNTIQIYQVPSPCGSISTVNLKATLVLPDKPHEFFLWRDPARLQRILAYVSFFSPIFLARRLDIDLRVYDLTGLAQGPALGAPGDPLHMVDSANFLKGEFSMARLGIPTTVAAPSTLAGLFTASQPRYAFDQTLHSMSVSVDGTRVFASQYNFGYYEIDSSLVAFNRPCDPSAPTLDSSSRHCLSKLNPDPQATYRYQPPYESGTHTAVKVPGRPYIYLVDEDEPGACPWGWVRILTSDPSPLAALDDGDLSPARLPAQYGAFALPENDPQRCAENVPKFSQGGVGTFAFPLVTFSAHNPLVFPRLAIESWWSGGLRVVDLDNPATPLEAGFFFPAPVRDERFCFDDTGAACQRLKTDPILQQRPATIPEVLMWSYPILKDGLIYVVDVNSGLFVLRYTGPGAEDLPATGICTSDAIQTPGFAPCRPFA